MLLSSSLSLIGEGTSVGMDFIVEKHTKKQKWELGDDARSGLDLDSLPREISLDILSRLPITSVVKSRFVCRSWHSLSHDKNLVNLHLSKEAKRNPVLIFHCDNPIQNQLYFLEFSDDGEGVVRKISVPFCATMPEFNVLGSCNGLLCLSDSLFNDSEYVYNPFTRDYIELPKSRQYHDQQVFCGFGFCQQTNEYKVVKIVYHRNVDLEFLPAHRMRMRGHIKSEVMVFSLGSTSWRSIGKTPYKLQRKSTEALFMNGRLHWQTHSIGSQVYNNVRRRALVSFDLADEVFHDVPLPEFGGPTWRHYHFALLGGCLSAITGTSGKLEIWIMKEYDVKDSWIKEFTIEVHLTPLNQNLRRPLRLWKNTFRRKARVLCVIGTGGILLELEEGRLALYDPESGKLNDITFQGMPKMFQTVVHVGSLNQVDIPI